MTPRFLLRYDTVNFADLMANGKLYRVPPFQRDYSWKEEQWEDLWEDLMDAYHNEASHHYMGAVVLVPQSDTEWLILDGQQRFATLSILVLAAIDVLGDYAAREDLAAGSRHLERRARRDALAHHAVYRIAAGSAGHSDCPRRAKGEHRPALGRRQGSQR